MARTKEQLRHIAEKLDRQFNAQHVGLGIIAMLFDSGSTAQVGTKERPVQIILKGIPPKDAVRWMREQADLIEKAEGLDNRLILPAGFRGV